MVIYSGAGGDDERTTIDATKAFAGVNEQSCYEREIFNIFSGEKNFG